MRKRRKEDESRKSSYMPRKKKDAIYTYTFMLLHTQNVPKHFSQLSAWVIAINDLCNFVMISTMGLFARSNIIWFAGLYYVCSTRQHYVWLSQFWSLFCGTNALFASKAKINVVWNFFKRRVPKGYPECRKNFKQRWF